VFDALTSIRPYKDAWSVEAALAEIEHHSGGQFDPRLVPLFVDLAQGLLADERQRADSRAPSLIA
jgi:putative two-component system response regulator